MIDCSSYHCVSFFSQCVGSSLVFICWAKVGLSDFYKRGCTHLVLLLYIWFISLCFCSKGGGEKPLLSFVSSLSFKS